MLAGEERPLQVDGEDVVPQRLGRLFQRGPRKDARIIHQDVQPAEFPHGVVDESLAVALVGDISPEVAGLGAVLNKLSHRALSPLLMARGDDDLSALPGQATRYTEADAGRATGDDGDSACNSICHACASPSLVGLASIVPRPIRVTAERIAERAQIALPSSGASCYNRGQSAEGRFATPAEGPGPSIRLQPRGGLADIGKYRT